MTDAATTSTVTKPRTELEAALLRLSGRLKISKVYRDYYAGDVGLEFISAEFRASFRHLLEGLNYNRCKRVIGAHADRMRIRGFSVESGPASVAKRASELWSRERMTNKAGQVHKESFLLGAAYVMVWIDEEERARLYPQRGDRCLVIRGEDDPDLISAALKVWRRADGRWRVTWYTAEGVHKYVSRSVIAEAFPTREDELERFEVTGEAWPLPYPEAFEGRVPVFAFPNDPDIDGNGMSELADVVNRQDHLNKILANRIVAGEAYALPQWWIAGVEMQRNHETGEAESPFDPNSRLWVMAAEAIKAGQFDPANLTHLIADEEKVDAQISASTGIPVHWLNPVTGAPSGESLKTIESPFTHKLIDRQDSFGPNWADVVTFAIHAEGTDGGDFQLTTDWAPPEPRSEKETWELALQKQAAGIPPEETWAEAGYSPDEIARFKALAEEKRKADAEKLAALMVGAEQERNAGGGFGGAGEDVEA